METQLAVARTSTPARLWPDIEPQLLPSTSQHCQSVCGCPCPLLALVQGIPGKTEVMSMSVVLAGSRGWHDQGLLVKYTEVNYLTLPSPTE